MWLFFFYPPLTWVTQTPSLINFASWTPAPSLPQESLQEPCLLTCISAVAQSLTHLTLQLKNHFSFQFCAVFWEDPLCCHRDGFTLPQSKCPVLRFYFSHCLLSTSTSSFFFFWLLPSVCSAQHWMQSTVLSACWLPVPRDCRWSAVRRRLRSLALLQ